MTDDMKKVKPIKYNLGKDNYLTMVPTVNGLHCWGYVAGEHIQFEDKDLPTIEEKISAYLTQANKKYMDKAIKLEEIALRIKENGLEKTSQHFNAPKNELDWIKGQQE